VGPASSTTPVTAVGEHRVPTVEPVAGLDACSQLAAEPYADRLPLCQVGGLIGSSTSVLPRSPTALLVFDPKRFVSHSTHTAEEVRDVEAFPLPRSATVSWACRQP
jgi:hypothetical protein